MKKEAQMYAEQDRQKRELAEVRNSADALIYSAEKSMREWGEKLSADLKKEIEDKIALLRKAKESDNIQEIKTAIDELSKTIQKIGAQMYGKSDQNKS
jgi:molecular chaperone DnaK